MPIFNYDVTSRPLSVGTAFELHLDGVPIRRGIILVNGPPMMAWLQNVSQRRAAGEAPDVKPLDYRIDSASFSRLVVAPVPEPYQAWLKSVPSTVKGACGETRKRPGPKPKLFCIAPKADELSSDEDLDGPGCDQPKSPTFSPERSVPVLRQLAGVNRLMLEMLAKMEQFEIRMKVIEEKLDRSLHLFNSQQTGNEEEKSSCMEHELFD